MPSPTHQNFVLLFCNHPRLTFELARRAGVPLLDEYERLEEAATEFEDPLRIENPVRADLALIGHLGGRACHGLVFEVQLDVDSDKEWSMVLYRAALRRKIKRPTWTVLFSPEPAVRNGVHACMFCEEPELRPQVVMPEMIPIVRDLEAAIADYPWAVLAATVHANGPDAVVCATVAIRALLRVAPENLDRYIQLVSASVGEDVMQQVREQLPPDECVELSEFERRGSSFTRGHAEGRAEGLEEGFERGLERGLAQGLEQGLEQGLAGMRTALHTVLAVRGLTVDDQTSERIAACSSIDALRELIARAATITNAADLFG